MRRRTDAAVCRAARHFPSAPPRLSFAARFGFLGNHPRATRRSCSFSSIMLHRQLHPIAPSATETSSASKNSDEAMQSAPAARKTGQQRAEKRYSAIMTIGWNKPIQTKQTAAAAIPAKFTGLTPSPRARRSFHLSSILPSDGPARSRRRGKRRRQPSASSVIFIWRILSSKPNTEPSISLTASSTRSICEKRYCSGRRFAKRFILSSACR